MLGVLTAKGKFRNEIFILIAPSIFIYEISDARAKVEISLNTSWKVKVPNFIERGL